jgi:tetratricopeptide (TPR) repeat protein
MTAFAVCFSALVSGAGFAQQAGRQEGASAQAGVSASEDPADGTAPVWVYLKLGEKAYRERELGDALRYFRLALGSGIDVPEALVGIGTVYQEEGDAISRREAFRVPDEFFQALYRLADVYRVQRRYRDYEETLRAVVSEDAYHTVPEQRALASAMGAAVRSKDLDKLLELYRSGIDFSTRAYRELGVFYYESGRYGHAIDHLMIATVKIFTAALEELSRIDPDYRYTGVSRTLDDALAVPVIRNFVLAEDLFRTLYYLGAALYAESRNGSVRSIWALVMNRSEAGLWAAKARRQYASPFIEPVTVR